MKRLNSGMLKRVRWKTSWALGVMVLFAFPTSGYALELNLDTVLEKALNASMELRIAQKDIDISRSDIKIARSEYFPVIQTRLNTEYLKDLELTTRPVTAVNNNVIPAGTRYQNSVGVTLNQTLIDFGARKRRIAYSRKEILSKTAVYDQTSRELKLKVIDLYTDALVSYRSIKAYQAILELAKQGYQMKNRLYVAGTRSKVEVATEAIQVAQTLDDMETLKQELARKLQDLAHYTQDNYEPDATELADLAPEALDPALKLDAVHSPEARNYDAQIEMKQKEIEILRRQALPQIALYSNYNLYGFDPDSLSKSIKNLSQRTISVGLSVSLPIFDGFKTQGQIQKAELEQDKLTLQKTKALLELKHQAEALETQAETHGVLLRTKATIVSKTQDKLTMETRLAEKQLIEKTVALQDHIARIRRQLEAETTLAQGIAARKKLRILKTGT